MSNSNKTASLLLGHPKTKQLLRDAFDAPIGSTKRAKAQKLIKTYKAMNANKFDGQGGAMAYGYYASKPKNDGKGGPTDNTGLSFDPSFVITNNKPKTEGFLDLRTILNSPTANKAALTSVSGSQTGSPATSTPSSLFKNITMPTSSLNMSQVPSSSPYSFKQSPITSSGSFTNTLKTETKDKQPIGATTTSKNYGLPSPTTEKTDPSKLTIGAGTFKPTGSTGNKDDQTFNQAIETGKKMLEEGKPWGEVWWTIRNKVKTGTNEEIDKALNKDVWSKPNAYEEWKKQKEQPVSEEKIDPNQQYQNLVGDQTGETNADETTKNPSEYGTLSEVVQSAVNLGLGPTTLTTMMLSNRKKLAEILGVPEESLPTGPTLAGTLQDEADRMQKESGLDEQYNYLLERIQTGKGLDTTLDAYVTGKDEYIKAVNETKDKLESFKEGVDMTNPFFQDTVGQYEKYLDILKGRQQKRYADFIKTSVDKYTADTEYLSNLYDKQSENFQTKLKYALEGKTEDFNNLKDMFKEMYENVENRETKDLEKQKLYNDVYGSSFDAANTSLDAFATKDQAFIEKVLSNNNIGGEKIEINDENGKLLESFDITNNPFINIINWGSTQKVTEGDKSRNLTPAEITSGIGNQITANKNLFTLVNNAQKGNKFLDTYPARVVEYINTYNTELPTSVTDGTLTKEEAQQIYTEARSNALAWGQKIQSAVYDASLSQLQGNPQVRTSINSALDDLVYNEKKIFRSAKPRTYSDFKTYANDWKTKYSTSINPGVLQSIIDYVNANMMANTNKDVTTPVKDILYRNKTINPATGESVGGTYNNASEIDPTNIANIISNGALYNLNKSLSGL